MNINERDLKEAQRVAKIGSWYWDSVNDSIWWSEQLYVIYERDINTPPGDYQTDQQNYTKQSALKLTDAVQHALKTGAPYVVELERKTPNGSRQWVQARGEVVIRENKIIGLRGTVQDITERKIIEIELNNYRLRLEELVAERTADIVAQRNEIAKLVNQDALTDLFNSGYARKCLKLMCDQALRENWQIALLFIDLDGFKNINDNFGHDAGDFILKTVSGILTDCTRSTDIVARHGGDEFLVILSGIPDSVAINQIANKIVSAIALPVSYRGNIISVSASIGITVFPDHANHADELLKKADQAMYVVKKSGKNNYCIHSEHD